MFFSKRQKRGGVPPHLQGGGSDSSHEAEFFRIEFDMMLKGAVIKRRSGSVRQFAVTVGGSTRLVTSGDTVDRETYDALVAGGVVKDARPTGQLVVGDAGVEEPEPPGETFED